jgi:UDP-N-acetylglucosamine enolpyruvyl transferase
MGYLGYKPADKPLTAADITDSIITSAKIVDGTIVNADINASAGLVLTKLASTGTLTVDNIIIKRGV